MTISSFTGRFTFLSNFSPSAMGIDSILYPTAEHAFQAGKTLSPYSKQQIAQVATPGAAKRMGRTMPLRDNWEEIKIPHMRQVLETKFTPHTDLANRLLGTGSHMIMEGNTWGDRFWGVEYERGQWIGQNWLGYLLMAQRAVLRSI